MTDDRLVIEPSILAFSGPYNRVQTVQLSLRNPTGQSVGFKVKTIQPVRYMVKPTKGTIGPGIYVTVAVHLQPLYSEKEVARFVASKQKFMFQWVVGDEGKSVDELFDNAKARINETKVDCALGSNPPSKEVSTSYKLVKPVPEEGPPSPTNQASPALAIITLPPPSDSCSGVVLTVVVAALLALLLAIFMAY